jgi:hypothetical protein
MRGVTKRVGDMVALGESSFDVDRTSVGVAYGCMDDMRRAELLLERLTCVDIGVQSGEPLALDESMWFLAAVERRLVEFTPCGRACTGAGASAQATRGHFETDGEPPHHLVTPRVDGELAFHRELVPAIAAYARAVIDLGYRADRASLLRRRTVHRRRVDLKPIRTRSDVELRSRDGLVHLQIKAMPSRQETRRLAAAIDAAGTIAELPEHHAQVLACVRAVEPRYLWLVGPNTVAPEAHVFRVRGNGKRGLERVPAVPRPR